MKRMLCKWCYWTAGAIVMLGSQAQAQTPVPAVPTSVKIVVIAATGDATSATATPAIATLQTAISATLNCNLAPVAALPAPVTNPKNVAFDDPFTAGRDCKAPLPTGLANGTYRAIAVLSATCVTNGTSAPCDAARSVVALPGPFSVTGDTTPPAAAQGVVLAP